MRQPPSSRGLLPRDSQSEAPMLATFGLRIIRAAAFSPAPFFTQASVLRKSTANKLNLRRVTQGPFFKVRTIVDVNGGAPANLSGLGSLWHRG